ncbi:MAG: RHS repeat-associated core domain-containing protein, partial [Calditrichaceae bacterium]
MNSYAFNALESLGCRQIRDVGYRDPYGFIGKMGANYCLREEWIKKNEGYADINTETEEDKLLSWYYFGARYYDPEIGRFLSVDPLAKRHPYLTPYHYT